MSVRIHPALYYITESLSPPCKVAVIGPTVQRKAPRLREVKLPVASPTAARRQTKGSIQKRLRQVLEITLITSVPRPPLLLGTASFRELLQVALIAQQPQSWSETEGRPRMGDRRDSGAPAAVAPGPESGTEHM